MITGLWFLVVTLCANGGDMCDDHIVDGGMTYTDCRERAAAYEFTPDLYSLRCDRGDVIREGE